LKSKNKKQKGKSCTLYGRREKSRKKKNNHHTPSHTKPYGRGHGDASKKIIEGQVWPPIDVVYTI